MKPLTPSPDPGLRIVWWNTGLAPGAMGDAFDLIASHWPSRLHLGRSDSERTHIAALTG